VPLHADSLHDLASPAHQISTMLELLLKRLGNERCGPEERELVELMKASTARLEKFIGGMRSYSRTVCSSGGSVCVDGSAIVQDACSRLDPVIREAGARLTIPPIPRFRCEPAQMANVFTNLIDNAVKFRGDTRAQVELSVEAADGGWTVTVEDQGIGIDPRHHESIFHLFRRLNGDRYPGVGIGLAVARGIVERHGGRIWVESELGKGARFRFTVAAG
jgi:signal transduction histidine kinase